MPACGGSTTAAIAPRLGLTRNVAFIDHVCELASNPFDVIVFYVENEMNSSPSMLMTIVHMNRAKHRKRKLYSDIFVVARTEVLCGTYGCHLRSLHVHEPLCRLYRMISQVRNCITFSPSSWDGNNDMKAGEHFQAA